MNRIGSDDVADFLAYRNENYRAARAQVTALLLELRSNWLEDPIATQLELAISDLAVAAYALGVQSGD